MLAKSSPASKSVLAPFATIESIAFVRVEALLLKAETNVASSVVPSLETSVLVEKLTTEIFKSLLSFNKLVINFFAESKINCFLVV